MLNRKPYVIIKHKYASMTNILLGKKVKTRILRPSELNLMRKQMKIEDRTQFDMILLLGARYEECRRIQKNPKWYDGNFVHVQEHKVKRVTSQRFIRLSSKGKNTIDYFFSTKKHLPTFQTYNDKLKRWAELAGIDPEAISVRSLRKTYESWLVISYPHASAIIYGSQGHNEITSLKHYTNMPFTADEVKEMKEWVDGYL